MNKKILGMYFIMLTSLQAEQTGICCVPVADLTVSPMATLYPTVPPKKWDTLLGLCPINAHEHSVPRMSQLLLNEPVIVLDATDNEYKIQTLDQSYGTERFTHNSIFWTAKQNILIRPHREKTTVVYSIRPLTIPELECTISAGTGFTFIKKLENNEAYLCSSLHPMTKKVVSFSMDQKNCCMPYKDKAKQKQAFIQLVRYWAQQTPNKIPYVLGGSSIIDSVAPEAFETRNLDPRKNYKVYIRPVMAPPYAGIDCAHLIFLAARISGIPLKSTNTIGLANTLIPFKKTDTIEAGDIALWKGHVIIITDPEKGLLTEARGYGAQYGIVQEIAFEEQFKDIKNSNDLLIAYWHKMPIIRLNKAGQEVQSITDLRLYKLP